MTTDPRGPREPLATAEQLTQAVAALGVQTGNGPPMPRAQALGALLFCVEMLTMFDVDRTDADSVRAGYINMALMACMVMEDERLPSGTAIPAAEFTQELWDAATFTFGRMLEHRLNHTLLDVEEMSGPPEPGVFDVGLPVRSWLRAVCTITPIINRDDVTKKDILRAAKAAKTHAADARQHLADMIKLAQSPA